jgi:hypothetical protein
VPLPLPLPLRSAFALCALRSALCAMRSALCICALHLRSALSALRSALCLYAASAFSSLPPSPLGLLIFLCTKVCNKNKSLQPSLPLARSPEGQDCLKLFHIYEPKIYFRRLFNNFRSAALHCAAPVLALPILSYFKINEQV